MMRKIKKYCLFLIIINFLTLSFTKDIYAKNKENIKKEGYLAVAKWDIDILVNNYETDMIAGNGIYDYELNIVNNSDIATNYILNISNIPEGLLVAIDDNEFQLPDSNNQVIFESFMNNHDFKIHIIHLKPTIELVNLNNYQIVIDVLCIEKDIGDD